MSTTMPYAVNRYKVGAFELRSGTLHVTDPCYGTDFIKSGFSGVIAAKPGLWNCRIYRRRDEYGDIWVQRLFVVHESIVDRIRRNEWEDPGFRVGVDSGSYGVFDAVNANQQLLYNECADAILSSKHQAAAMECGAVSSTGVGDGIFRCLVVRLDGAAVAVRIG